ncbi:MAG: hypothetical protein KJ737_26595 [Proteobacteria bacterium]|nr:hypothetical protein [Pseudomonadota bacterium]
MKKIVIASLVSMMILTLGMGTSMGKMNKFAKGLKNFAQEQNFYADGQTCINKIHWRANIHHALLKRLYRCLNNLDLSDDVRAVLATVLKDYRDAQETRNDAMKTAVKTYWDVLTAPELDEAALEAAENAIAGLKDQDLNLKFELVLAIRNLLSEDQIAELSDCFDFDRCMAEVDALEDMEETASE